MLHIDGTVKEGLRAASGFTIAAQMPCLEKEIPEIKGVYHGTINLLLDRQLRIDNPDREILCVWCGPPGEVFGILEITIEFPLAARQSGRGFIYPIIHRIAATASKWRYFQERSRASRMVRVVASTCPVEM
jgi:RNA:NAD 2'-phosphotransferase (TPT1/KptA family)